MRRVVAWLMGEDLVHSDPNTNRVNLALQRLDLLIVEEIFLTETAKLAREVAREGRFCVEPDLDALVSAWFGLDASAHGQMRAGGQTSSAIVSGPTWYIAISGAPQSPNSPHVSVPVTPGKSLVA